MAVSEGSRQKQIPSSQPTNKLSLNGILWALGMEASIPAEGSKTDYAARFEPKSNPVLRFK